MAPQFVPAINIAVMHAKKLTAREIFDPSFVDIGADGDGDGIDGYGEGLEVIAVDLDPLHPHLS